LNPFAVIPALAGIQVVNLIAVQIQV
jgi:hypothetical protein